MRAGSPGPKRPRPGQTPAAPIRPVPCLRPLGSAPPLATGTARCGVTGPRHRGRFRPNPTRPGPLVSDSPRGTRRHSHRAARGGRRGLSFGREGTKPWWGGFSRGSLHPAGGLCTGRRWLMSHPGRPLRGCFTAWQQPRKGRPQTGTPRPRDRVSLTRWLRSEGKRWAPGPFCEQQDSTLSRNQ